MNTTGPALKTAATAQGGASIFDRLKGLTQSLDYTKPLLSGLYLNPPPAPAKEARPRHIAPIYGTETDTASS